MKELAGRIGIQAYDTQRRTDSKRPPGGAGGRLQVQGAMIRAVAPSRREGRKQRVFKSLFASQGPALFHDDGKMMCHLGHLAGVHAG